MTSQTSGADRSLGKTLAGPAAPPCSYAACDKTAKTEADGWWFCPAHLREHEALAKGDDWVFENGAAFRILRPCGTSAAAKRHWRRGEDCTVCRDAETRRRNGYASQTGRKRWVS